MKRHTCIICGKKRIELKMKNVFGSCWVCTTNDFMFVTETCSDSKEILIALRIIEDTKKLKNINLKHIATAAVVSDQN